MSPTPELKKKLKLCDLEIQNFVANLQLENAKLQRRIAKLEAEKITSHNRILALQKELKKGKPQGVFHFQPPFFARLRRLPLSGDR
jgi:regulator of replication initiation timing